MCSVTSVESDSLRPYGLAPQAPPSMGFSRQEYCSGLPCPPPGDLPDPVIESVAPAWQVDSLPLSHQGSPCYEVDVIINFISQMKNTRHRGVK